MSVIYKASTRRLHRIVNPMLLLQTATVGVAAALSQPLSLPLAGVAVAGVGLLAIMRRYERQTVMSLKSGNGREVEVETVGLTGLPKTRRISVDRFYSTNRTWPTSSFWLAVYVAREGGKGKETLLFESSGVVVNPRLFNDIVSPRK